MRKQRTVLDRRNFLIKNAYFLLGSLSGLSLFTKAFACDGPVCETPLKPKISLIIDDIGFNGPRLRLFLELYIPLTFAILPRLPRTRTFAEEIRIHEHEIMLHQPMEPSNPNVNPGLGALYVEDDSEKIIDTMEKNISEIPYISGINNHMGSKFTSSYEKMCETLRLIKDRNLFFIDSLTTSNSTAYQIATRLQMPAAFRNIFLDNIPEERYILGQLNRLKRHAIMNGHAIGIGHPYPITAKTIELFVHNLHDSGISLVHVSQLINMEHA